MEEPGGISWAPRVRPEKIRRLYESDARGLLDAELLDEVGFGLYSRCRDVLEVSQAVRGRVKCRQCGEAIARQRLGQPEEKLEKLVCERCGWQIQWDAYLKSYQGQRLFAGQADEIFTSFLQEWERALLAQTKMIAIDNLIHAFHLYQDAPGRPVGVNVIHGNVQEVIDLIDGLAYGAGSTPGLEACRDRWRAGFESSLCYPARQVLASFQAGFPEFGRRDEGVEYIPRLSAYAVILDTRRRLAVIQVDGRCFLPGGGCLPGEIPEDTLRREIREECGREIHIQSKIGEAINYLYASKEGAYYQIHGHFYQAAFGKKTSKPVEKDQLLIWMGVDEAVDTLYPAQAWAVRSLLQVSIGKSRQV